MLASRGSAIPSVTAIRTWGTLCQGESVSDINAQSRKAPPLLGVTETRQPVALAAPSPPPPYESDSIAGWYSRAPRSRRILLCRQAARSRLPQPACGQGAPAETKFKPVIAVVRQSRSEPLRSVAPYRVARSQRRRRRDARVSSERPEGTSPPSTGEGRGRISRARWDR